MSQLRPDYCLLILSMCIITFITFQYVIIPKSSVIKCKDLRCTAEAQHKKKSFLSTFVFVTVIEDYPKFSQISCPAPKLVPNHHNWQWGARPSRSSLYTEWHFGNNDDHKILNQIFKVSFCVVLYSDATVQYLTGRVPGLDDFYIN